MEDHKRMLNRWVENALRRDDVILRMQPYCPRCGTRQVQIMDKKIPAQWKCRDCKLQFNYEAHL